jgi:hypothetical protein
MCHSIHRLGQSPERRLDKALFMFGKFLKVAKKYA